MCSLCLRGEKLLDFRNLRTLLHAVIQNAVVTSAATLWPVALRVDAFILRAAEVLPFEEVNVINVATGEGRSVAEIAELYR